MMPSSWELFEPAVVERRYLRRVEVGEGAPVPIAALEDGGPGQARLSAFEGQHLEQMAVVVRGDAPFAVVVVAHRRRTFGPRAPAFRWT